MPKPKATPLQTVLNYVFDKILFKYQRQWVLDQSRFKIINKSRQIGFSTAIALEALLDVMRGESVYFISRSERQSIYLLDKFYQWSDYFTDAGIVFPYTSKTKTDCKINNVDVKSLTSKASTAEGFSGNIFLDEFSLHEADEQIYRSLFPTISHGYKIRIVSRPFGQSNTFYRIFNDTIKYKDYVRYQVDIYQAVKQGLKIDVDDLKNNIDEEGFSENFLCEFIDESTSFFPYDLIRKCIADIEDNITGRKWIGIDVGRTNDNTAIITLTKDGNDNLNLTRIEVLNKKSFVEQKAIISQIIEVDKPQGVMIDKGAVGYQLAEDLERDFPGVVKGIVFNPSFKLQVVTNLKKTMEQSKLRIPDDHKLLSEIHSIKKILNNNNTISFNADRTSKGHADRAFALMLALESATPSHAQIRIRWV